MIDKEFGFMFFRLICFSWFIFEFIIKLGDIMFFLLFDSIGFFFFVIGWLVVIGK